MNRVYGACYEASVAAGAGVELDEVHRVGLGIDAVDGADLRAERTADALVVDPIVD